MTQFKSGDLVVLKSGGPVMTVDTVNTDIFDDSKITGLLCVWFAGDFMHRVRFDYRAVRLVSARQEAEPPVESKTGNGAANGAAHAAAAMPAPLAPAAAAATEAPPVAAASEAAADAPPADAPRAAHETTGEYAAVLDTMVGAMNAAAELMEAQKPRATRRPKATTRGNGRSKSTTTH